MNTFVLSKVPHPGRVKTRLMPVLGRKRSARLHRRMLARTLALTSQAQLSKVVLAVSPGRFSHALRSMGYPLRVQCQGDLGRRMDQLCRAFPGPTLLLGVDCPELCVEDLQRAEHWLTGAGDCVLGPARDGGYWMIGLKQPQARLFSGINWGSSTVLAQTRRQIRRLGLACLELPLRGDIDRPADLAKIRLEQPGWLR